MVLGDTICAPATPPVNSSIAIIRVSGAASLKTTQLIFSKKILKSRHGYYGSITDKDNIIDDVVLIYYKGPHSYTGEDMVEIFCHGNQLIVQNILSILNSFGIRLAEPGEFTKIAFLNGKMDLTEAEAVNHLITARSDWEIETAIKQMHGSLRDTIRTIKETIIELKADIETGIDFIEENIEFISHEDSLKQIVLITKSIDDVLKKCKIGSKLSHGIDITITGKPNVGKSSILNCILNQERAIVSDIPGTTRDMIKEAVQIGGFQFNLIDTAGINNSDNEIEKLGIELSHKSIESTPILLMVLDSTTGITEYDTDILEKVKEKQCIYIINKIDIAKNEIIEYIETNVNGIKVRFSAKTGEGITELENALLTLLKNELIDTQNTYITDLRMIHLLEKGLENVSHVKELILNNEPSEIIAFELQSLLDTLSDITGEITPDDILNSIFSRFCIGK